MVLHTTVWPYWQYVGSHYLREKAVPDDHYVQPGTVWAAVVQLL